MQEPVILFRKNIDTEEEFEIAKKYFTVVEQRTDCHDNLVIGRYSVLPYYLELEKDLETNKSYLINRYYSHRWIADLQYYDELKQYTPETWDDTNFHACTHPGPFVVKGRTNSRKHDWNQLMFAPDKRAAANIACELMKDPFIGPQGVVYRKYIPLKTFEYGLNGLPFTNEFRFFFYGKTMLSYGYYWTSAEVTDREIAPEAIELAKEIAVYMARHANFFVLDLAEKEEGGWILVEVNDACMAGLSENDPDTLYKNFKTALEKREKKIN